MCADLWTEMTNDRSIYYILEKIGPMLDWAEILFDKWKSLA